MSYKYNRDHNYKREYSFSRVKFGIDNPILETELNEMQKIQEDARASLVRQMIPSGFLEKATLDFNGDSMIMNPNNDPNKIAIAPCRAMLNGYEVLVQGKEVIDGNLYEVVDLGDAPTSYTEDNGDFVFLEMWFQEIGENSNVYKNGNANGENLILPSSTSPILDDRVGSETARRVGLKYRIRVQKNAKFNSVKSVFETTDIYAQGSLPSVPTDTNSRFVFEQIGHQTGDFGLFVASDDNINQKLSVLDDAVYAIPMFFIFRRVDKDYLSPNIDLITDAPKKPTDPNKVSYRPDGLFCDFFVENDIVDVRNMVSFSPLNENLIFDEAFKKIITGALKTKSVNKVKRKEIVFDGISNSFDNRPHVEEVVQLVDVDANDEGFLFEPSFNNQIQLYDPFNFLLKESYITTSSVKFSFVRKDEYSGFGFKVQYRKTDEQNWSETPNLSVPNANAEAIVSGLLDYTLYDFRLKATKDATIYYSKELTARTLDGTAPTVPQNLVVASDGLKSKSVTLTWSASTDNSGVVLYKIYKNGALLVAAEQIERTTYKVTGLEPQTEYNFQVSAIDNSNLESAKSSILSIETAAPVDSQAPTAPSGLTIDTKTFNSIYLNWNASTDNVGVSKYNLYLNDEIVFTIDVSSNTDTAYNFTTLQPKTTYVLGVSAEDDAGNKSSISTFSVETKEQTSAPNAPTGLGVVVNNQRQPEITKNKIKIKWNSPQDNGVQIKEYKVYFRPTSGTNVSDSTLTQTDPTITELEISPLNEGRIYQFQVVAIGTNNIESSRSIAFYIPTKPSPPTPNNNVSTADKEAILKWTPPSNGDTNNMNYEFFQEINSKKTEIDKKNIERISNDKNSIKLKNLTQNTQYKIYIRTFLNSFSLNTQTTRSDFSSAITFETTNTGNINAAPGDPKNVKISFSEPAMTFFSRGRLNIESGAKTTIQWDPATDADGNLDKYNLYRNGEKVGSVDKSVNEYTFVGLLSNKEYTYGVESVDIYNLNSLNTPTVTRYTNPLPPVLQSVRRVGFEVDKFVDLDFRIYNERAATEKGFLIYQIYYQIFIKGTPISVTNEKPITEVQILGINSVYDVKNNRGIRLYFDKKYPLSVCEYRFFVITKRNISSFEFLLSDRSNVKSLTII